MKEQQPISFYELAEFARSDLDKSRKELVTKCIYVAYEVSDRDVQLDDMFYIDEQPEVIRDSEVLPSFAQAHDLEVFCLGSALMDVIRNAVGQKSDVTDNELFEALDYYLYHDSFYIFAATRIREKQLALLPPMTPKDTEKLLKKYGERRLREYCIHYLQNAVLMVSDDEKADFNTLCQFVAQTKKAKTLYIRVSKDFWSHILCQGSDWISPAKYILPGQERKKKPKTKTGPIPSAFLSFSEKSTEDIIGLYLRAAAGSDDVKAECIMEEEKYFVRATDRYPVGDGRQAYDFLNYLGLSISSTIC